MKINGSTAWEREREREGRECERRGRRIRGRRVVNDLPRLRLYNREFTVAANAELSLRREESRGRTVPRPRLLIFYASHSTTLVREGRRFGIERTGNEPLRRGADFRAQRKPPRIPLLPFSPPVYVCMCVYVFVCALTPAISRKMNFERGQACRTGLEILDVLDKFWEERDGVRIRMIKGWMFLGCGFFSRLWRDWVRRFWLFGFSPITPWE